MYSVVICDTRRDVCEGVVKQLASGASRVRTHCGPLATLLARLTPSERVALVSPGNSYGFLGGGFDLALCTALGGAAFEAWFRARLRQQRGPYCPVGSCSVVGLAQGPFAHRNVQYVVHVPTVVTPRARVLDGSARVFDAMWNALEQCPGDVDLLVVPGLATGYAGVPPAVSCKSMAFALAVHGLDVSVELRNALIMYYLGCGYDGFFSEACRAECYKAGIDVHRLRAFDARYDAIQSILPT